MPSSSSRASEHKASVALATWNGQRHLEALLDSVARQTLLPAELVISDDASTDGTVKLLEDFSRRAPFPVHIHSSPTNLGVLDNFHRVFGLCTQEYIAYCDQDDIWAPEKLARCLATLTQPGVVLVSHRSRLTDSELSPLGIVQPDNLEPGRYRFPHFPLRYWCLGHQMVFSRELLPIIDKLRFTASSDIIPLECLDGLIPIVAGMVGDTVFIPEDLVDFRRHGQAVTFAHNFHADNRTDSSKSSLNARLINKQRTLARQRETILALCSWLEKQDLQRAEAGKSWADYAAHLQRVLRDVETRLALHKGSNLFLRARAFASGLATLAYRDPRRNGAGRQQVLIDLLAVFKPARS